jgi:hypothetical protein
MRSSIKSRVINDTATQRPRQELEDYLDAPLKDVDNVVGWWGVCIIVQLLLLAY